MSAWTQAEEDTLRRLHGTQPTAAIAALLGRTVKAVHEKALKLGLRHRQWGAKRSWTAEERAYVAKHYGPMTARQLAAHLGRSEQSVAYITRQLQ